MTKKISERMNIKASFSIADLKDKIPELKGKFWAFYWAVPIFLLIPLGLIYWLWKGSHFYNYIVYGSYLLYTFVTYILAKRRIKKDFKAGKAFRYEGLISDAQFIQKKAFLRTLQQVVVSIHQDHETKSFVLWENRRRPFIDQDKSLRYRLDELKKSSISILQLPKSGYIISYSLADAQGHLVRDWGMTSFSILSSQLVMTDIKGKTRALTKNKVDYIHFEKNESSPYFVLQLSSASEKDTLTIPSFLPNFPDLEIWMATLPEFEASAYQHLKAEEVINPITLLYERTEKEFHYHQNTDQKMYFNIDKKSLKTVNRHGMKESILIKDIDLISIRSSADPRIVDIDYQITFHGFAISPLTIDSVADQFELLLDFLYQLPGFDRAAFLKLLPKLTKERQLIWQAKPNADAFIEKSDASLTLKQLEQGIVIENCATTIPWKDYHSLAQSGITQTDKASLPNPDFYSLHYHIQNAVILKGLKVPSLTYTAPSLKNGEKLNLDWPLQGASAAFTFGLTGAENYQKLKEHLTEAFGELPKLNESDDSLDASWSYGRLQVRIQAWAPHNLFVFYNYCQLLISYEPDVSSFFEDAYVNNFVLSSHIQIQTFEATLEITADYKDNRFVRKTPEELAYFLDEKTNCIIWIDQDKGVIGIGNKQFAHIQSLKNHHGWLFMGHYWRDHEQDMSLYFHKEKNQNTTSFDNFVGRFTFSEEWGALIKKIDAFVPLDCNFIEDRQYY